MPVARVIAQNPQDCDEVCRLLAAAGFTVCFATPDEEFDPGDFLVAAATVHRDYALQYAAEVAQQSDGDVIVAPGVASGSFPVPIDPAASVGTLYPDQPERSNEVEDAAPVPGRLSLLAGSVRGGWERLRAERELAREQRRLQRERAALQAEERRQLAMRARAEEEARMTAERERLRLQRQAEEEHMRHAAELERQRVAEAQARLAAEREQLRLQREAKEEQVRQAAEAERRRAGEEAQRRMAEAVPAVTSVQPAPAVVAAQAPPSAAPVAVPPRRALHTAARVVRYPSASRQRQLQRAVLLASVVALLAMIGFALAMNVDSRSPLPNALTNNPVQEESPFGPAHTAQQQATTTVVPTRVATPAPPVRPRPIQAAATKAPAAVPGHHATRRRRATRDDVAEDQVIIHHYGATKHPPASGTRASMPRYSDQQ